jgi:hypothetical protein
MVMSVGTMEIRPVAKKKAGRPKAESVRGVGKPVRLDPEVVNMANTIANRRGIKVGPYLSGLLETPVKRDYVALLRELSRLEQEGGK